MSLELDHDRRLALAYVPAGRRAAIEALWNLDLALASVLTTGREPMISRIRLAWWREALERLDSARPPAEPVLQALAGLVLPAGISGAELAEMEEGWDALLSPEPLTPGDLRHYGSRRGGLLFLFSARLLGMAEPAVAAPGTAWALMDFARHSSTKDEAVQAADLARQQPEIARWAKPIRPLGMLARLAARDSRRDLEELEKPGAPARMLVMLRHRLTGR